MATDIGGVWRTIGGRRVFIKDGEDLATAMKKSGKFKNNKKDEPKEFKDSKIRDENGNLLTVYHGTSVDFEEFNEKYIRERKDGIKGFYFAPPDRKDSVAGYYAGEKGTIKEVYLNIKKPLYIKTNEKEKLNDIIKSGKINNYDGIVTISSENMPETKYYDYREKVLKKETIKKGDIIEIIAFNKDQIKIKKNK